MYKDTFFAGECKTGNEKTLHCTRRLPDGGLQYKVHLLAISKMNVH